jgi:arylsulfatase A-like enzyme
VARHPDAPFARFELTAEEEARQWTVRDGEARITDKGLRLVQPRQNPQFLRDVDIDSARACLVVVEAGGAVPPENLELYWTRPDGSSGMNPTAREGTTPLIAAFAVPQHRGWTGRITGLRVAVRGGRRVTLQRVSVHGCRAVDPGAVVAAARQPWRIELGADQRVGLLLTPGVEHEWTVVVPSAAEMRFAAGSRGLRSLREATGARLEVAALAADGRATGVEGRFPAPAAWAEQRMALAGLAGRRVKLRFRMLGGGPEDILAVGEPRLVAATAAAPGAPDVILMSLDTVRADRLSLYGNRTPTTPGIDAWARKHAVVFRNAYSGAGHTLASHAAMLSGRHAFRAGIMSGGAVPMLPSTELVSQRLRRAGYRTVAVAGGGFVHPSFGFDRGFERFAWTPGVESDVLEQQVTRALGVLDEPSDRPLFLFFHTYEAHAPYLYRGVLETAGPCHPKDLVLMAAGERLFWRGADGQPAEADPAPLPCLGPLYDDGLAYLDRHVGRLLQRLTRPDRARIVIITADHGEALGEAGRFEHGWTSMAVAHVPLLIAGPGLTPGWSDVHACGVDVVPTLLRMAGQAADGLDGQALFATPTSRACIYSGLRPGPSLARHEAGGRTIVAAIGRHSEVWSFDRRRDPDGLARMRVPSGDPGRQALEALVADFERIRQERAGAAEAREGVSPELAEQLRALGYVQ